MLPRGSETAALQHELSRHFLPFSVVIPLVPGPPQEGIAATLPLLASMRERNGEPTAFVCRDFTCREPVNSPTALAEQLGAR